MSTKCVHNQRCRYTDGFYCEDCKQWFGKHSATYRSGEYLSILAMVLHNINATRHRNNQPAIEEVQLMQHKIGIDKKHDDYESVIQDAEMIIRKYGSTPESATITLTS